MALLPTLDDFLAYVAPDNVGAGVQTRATTALAAAKQAVYAHCGRDFTVSSASSTRTYRPEPNSRRLSIDDCTTISAVVENGTSLTVNVDYVAEPLNNRNARGRTVPCDSLVRYGQDWHRDDVLPTVSVTAVWGWSTTAVPDEAVEAVLMLAKDVFQARDLRGDVAGFTDFGAVRIRQNGQIASLLKDLRRLEAWAGIA